MIMNGDDRYTFPLPIARATHRSHDVRGNGYNNSGLWRTLVSMAKQTDTDVENWNAQKRADAFARRFYRKVIAANQSPQEVAEARAGLAAMPPKDPSWLRLWWWQRR